MSEDKDIEKMIDYMRQKEMEKAYKYRQALPFLVALVTALSDESLAMPDGRLTLRKISELASEWMAINGLGCINVSRNAKNIDECYRASNLPRKPITFEKIQKEEWIKKKNREEGED